MIELATPDELTRHLEEPNEVSLVLFGLSMPGAQGLVALAQLCTRFPDMRVIAVSPQRDQSTLKSCLEIGVAGFIPKSLSAEAIQEAVKQVLKGDVWIPNDLDDNQEEEDGMSDVSTRLSTLTPQQVRVLVMLSEGLLNKQIAYQLGVSEATVKAHVSAILQKLDVNSRTQAVIAVNRLESLEWQTAAH